MSDEQDEESALQARLEPFIVRARRVKAHSLVRDVAGLKELAAVRFKFVVDDLASGQGRRFAELADEEAIESLAARVRPVILEREPVHWAVVVKALRRLAHLRDDQVVQEELKRLKAAWKESDPSQGKGRFFYLQVGPADGSGLHTTRDDADLALGWVYGDLVHADAARRADLEQFGITSRFGAAITHVARVA